ncbi:hypothetical protein OEZ60_20585 [Defluviimonas sp. WL0024]|uniref:Uncharacterized protein n=1 Tax=Albidovulum salinarum TaxID=2984153 RepID=A0ABT2X8V6_9RHOB|nr:hypothetical protein [Defluviimonas sp. WL0024]MCU9850386.1 hypothetical protein [Defluviimonas sp. WL0024]
MTQKDVQFQPGAILHDAIVGSFRAGGRSFEVWCADHGISPATARNVTFGQSKGPKGRALLARIIDAAGRDVVRAAYEARLKDHYESFKKGGA